MLQSVIVGTGAYIPAGIHTNDHFINDTFYEENGSPIKNNSEVIIEKFAKITGIRERRYVASHLVASDIAAEAGKEAIANSGIDPETLDQIIVAHNFGDVSSDNPQTQNVPSLASRVKSILGIKNPSCIAYDILFGCPGWVQAVIQSQAYFKAGMASKVLLIGSETLSRVIDSFDRDSMIFADGAGACILSYQETGAKQSGILGSCAVTHTGEETDYINMGKSYCQADNNNTLYMKMKGRKVYEYALTYVPPALQECLDRSGVSLQQVKMIFLHQANEKMDEEIVKRLYQLNGITEMPADILPMSIQWLGNSSVATVPTLYHMVLQGNMPDHKLQEGDIVLFASVGAGMSINAVCYRV